MASHTLEDPMTKREPKTKAVSRARTRKIAKPKAPPKTPKAKSLVESKRARIVKVLSAPKGTTIAAIVAATGWQQHSVRGFLAGIIRKRLGLNLLSEKGSKGRVYRVEDGKSSLVSAARAKQAA